MMRLALLALVALFACLALAPAAGAQSGVDQYLEQVPNADGKSPADGEEAGPLPDAGEEEASGDNASATAPPGDDGDGGGSGVLIAVIAVLVLVPLAFLLYRRFAGRRGGAPEQA